MEIPNPALKPPSQATFPAAAVSADGVQADVGGLCSYVIKPPPPSKEWFS